VCISNARSASIESQSDSEKFRENKGNLDQVQGVHNVKEVTKHRRTRNRGTPGGREEFIFKKSFDLSYRNPENARCVWEIKILLRTKLRRDNTFTSVDEIQESDS
jgi:hypothetical protein